MRDLETWRQEVEFILSRRKDGEMFTRAGDVLELMEAYEDAKDELHTHETYCHDLERQLEDAREELAEIKGNINDAIERWGAK